jgi:hypothetical protein
VKALLADFCDAFNAQEALNEEDFEDVIHG